MAFRFRKKFRIAHGIDLNLGKKSASVRVGGKGFGFTAGTSGKTISGSIPGTGIGYTKRLKATQKEPAEPVPGSGWRSWKPERRDRPPGDWRQFGSALRVAGLKHWKADLGRFGEGAARAETQGLDFGLDVQRDPQNLIDKNAIAVVGRWTTKRSRWFRPPEFVTERAQIGWIERDTAALLSLASPLFPIAAEFYEMAVADNPDPELGFGVIVKIILLVPSFSDPVWGETSRIICGK